LTAFCLGLRIRAFFLQIQKQLAFKTRGRYKMPEIDHDLARFFAWARAKAYAEFDQRMQADPSLDPNWLFSDIMQGLLEEYRRTERPEAAKYGEPQSTQSN